MHEQQAKKSAASSGAVGPYPCAYPTSESVALLVLVDEGVATLDFVVEGDLTAVDCAPVSANWLATATWDSTRNLCTGVAMGCGVRMVWSGVEKEIWASGTSILLTTKLREPAPRCLAFYKDAEERGGIGGLAGLRLRHYCCRNFCFWGGGSKFNIAFCPLFFFFLLSIKFHEHKCKQIQSAAIS